MPCTQIKVKFLEPFELAISAVGFTIGLDNFTDLGSFVLSGFTSITSSRWGTLSLPTLFKFYYYATLCPCLRTLLRRALFLITLVLSAP